MRATVEINLAVALPKAYAVILNIIALESEEY